MSSDAGRRSFLAWRIGRAEVDRLLGRHAITVHDAAADSRSAPYAAWRAPATCRRSRRNRGPCPSRASRPWRSASSAMSRASSMLPPDASISRKPPSGSVTDWRRRPRLSTSMISRLPPPRSPAKPSARVNAHHDAVARQARPRAVPDRTLDLARRECASACGDEVRSVLGLARRRPWRWPRCS